MGHETISRNRAHNSNLVTIDLTSTLMLVILIVLQSLCEMIPAGLDISRWYDGGKYDVIQHMLRLTYHVILTFTCDLDTNYFAQFLKHDISKPQYIEIAFCNSFWGNFLKVRGVKSHFSVNQTLPGISLVCMDFVHNTQILSAKFTLQENRSYFVENCK